MYKQHLDGLKGNIIDPLGLELAKKVQWKYLNGLSIDNSDLFPIAITGKGSPLLLLHGFDSSFLEFRRLAPLLIHQHQLIIPDLFGFGFCPRNKNASYGKSSIINHLSTVLNELTTEESVGVIGASMGGALAMELARHHPDKISKILLLSPAGLTGQTTSVPRPLDQLGVWFLKQRIVRKSLCRQAFANPKNSVSEPEEQIASLHLNVPGWGRSLAAFARSGGVADCGSPLPQQPVQVLWGEKDRILNKMQKNEANILLGQNYENLKDCGHLPHLDLPHIVAEKWLKNT